MATWSRGMAMAGRRRRPAPAPGDEGGRRRWLGWWPAPAGQLDGAEEGPALRGWGPAAGCPSPVARRQGRGWRAPHRDRSRGVPFQAQGSAGRGRPERGRSLSPAMPSRLRRWTQPCTVEGSESRGSAMVVARSPSKGLWAMTRRRGPWRRARRRGWSSMVGGAERWAGGSSWWARGWVGESCHEAPSFPSLHLTPAGGLIHHAQELWHPA